MKQMKYLYYHTQFIIDKLLKFISIIDSAYIINVEILFKRCNNYKWLPNTIPIYYRRISKISGCDFDFSCALNYNNINYIDVKTTNYMKAYI